MRALRKMKEAKKDASGEVLNMDVNKIDAVLDRQLGLAEDSPRGEAKTKDSRPKIKPEGKKGQKAAGKPSRIKEWREFQQELRGYENDKEALFELIRNELHDYRIILTQMDFKAPKFDEQIWELYHFIEDEIPHMRRKRLEKRPLTLHSYKKLRARVMAWRNIYAKKEALMELLEKAPKALEFYNKMQIMREQRSKELILKQEQTQKITAARKSLETALEYIERRNTEGEEITYGSNILRLDEAQQFWEKNLREVFQIEQAGTTNADEVLEKIYTLETVVREAPSLARRVREIEEQFGRLSNMHDMLAGYGKSLIPKSELARTTIMLYERIPALWATGQHAELDRILEKVKNFINSYEETLQYELSYAERRRPGATRAMLGDGVPNDSFGLPNMISLARSLVNAVDSRDRFMRGHSDRVTRIAVNTARRMNWGGSDLEYLELAALLHDVGKISIPESILTKVSPLTNEEWKIIKMHPYYGAQILKPLEPLNRIIPWVYHHQEKWDGSGYPDNLAKKDIPAASAIINVAEAFSVMTIDMPTRDAMPILNAVDQIKEGSGKQFSPEVVEAFVDVAEAYKS